MIATSSIAISPVYEDPTIPSKVTYKYNTKNCIQVLEKVKQVGLLQVETETAVKKKSDQYKEAKINMANSKLMITSLSWRIRSYRHFSPSSMQEICHMSL